jgi:hypothetical protein
VVDDLIPGIWTITAEAVNIQGYVIGEGSATDTIVAGQLTQITVTVTPLSGPGEFGVSLSWPGALVANPSVFAQMQTVGSSVWFDLDFPITGNSATYNPTAPFNPIFNGYYKMTIQLKDGDAVVWGAFEAVRILAGWKSEGSYPLTEDDITPATGDVDIIIDPDLQNPIDIGFEIDDEPYDPATDPREAIATGDTRVVKAIPDPPDPGDPIAYTYEWYLNGAPLLGEDQPNITIGDGLGVGNYNLDVAVTTYVLDNSVPPQAIPQTVSSNRVYFSMQVPTDNDINATVEYSILPPITADLTGKTVYVTTFEAGGNIADDAIEEETGVMESDFDVLIKLDNSTIGYTNDTYGIRAHIDADDTGDPTLTSGDFITVSEVTVDGADADKTLFGPWGGYLAVPVYIDVGPGISTENLDLYVVLVENGDTWGNYPYAEGDQVLPANPVGVVFGANAWAPFGQYSFFAVIDVGDDFDGTPASGDYVYSNEGIIWSSGPFPAQRVDSWTLIP